MKEQPKKLKFFLGANTPQGFVSRFDQLADYQHGGRTLIIKGGPGSGKSTLMKKIAAQFDDGNAEYIHCSSDPDSLDAVIFPHKKLAICDGTPPHVLEPRYPGAADIIIDLTTCWNEDALSACREDIIALSNSCTRCHEHSCRFLSAAASLIGDTYRIALESVNTAKLAAYCRRLSEREFKPKLDTTSSEVVRFFSAVTNKGCVHFCDTAKVICDRIYLIVDDYGAVSRLILSSMRSAALSAGYDVISCYCPISPYEKLEQLFIPELSLGFMTSNKYHDFGSTIDPFRIVNSQRFSDQSKLKANKKRITFNRKAANQMIEQAAALLKEAKKTHDELESYYIAATDFDKVNELTDRVVERIRKY